MKTLSVTWDGVADPTGYLFSFAKSLSCALKHSPWHTYAEDIVATSGFAFRMWVAADLCPSGTSIWEFDGQKRWVENGGLTCDYAGRYWGQEAIEEQKHREAVAIIQKSIDNGVPAVSWDIGVPEWGLLTGYDDEAQTFSTLAINASAADPASPAADGARMPYDALGKREIPILSVLAVTGTSGKSPADILKGTVQLAASHLKGEEWCDKNARGLDAYPALIRHFEEAFNPEASWNMEYYLGTYGALKTYAQKYFAKMGQEKLAGLYQAISDGWISAFQAKTGEDINSPAVRAKIASLLRGAWEQEKQAVTVMSGM